MRDNGMREIAEDKKTGLGPSLAYKMRKGLLKGKEVVRNQYNADNTDSEVDDAVNRSSYGINQSASTIRSVSNRKNRKTGRTITSNTTPFEGAANGAAPSFEMPENVGIPNGNHWSTSGIPGDNHWSTNDMHLLQSTRKAFIRNKQAEMFIQNNGTKSLTGPRSAKTGRKKAGEKIRGSVRRVAKTAADGLKNLYVLLAGGSAVPLIVVVVICSIGLAVGSVFGIFFSGQNTGSGKAMQELVQELNAEYQDKISEVKASVNYDYLDLSGASAVWREILAVYAVRAASGPAAVDVASLDEGRIEFLKETFWDMNSISSDTEIITEVIETEIKDDEGNTIVKTEEVEKTVLKIRVGHKTANDMALEYAFDVDQQTEISELLDEDNDALWAAVLYGIYEGDEYLLSSAAASRVGNFNAEVYIKGPMIWPLDSSYHTITDPFGFRIHPIKKTGQNHSGTDIGAPEGANIYAVLPGKVVASGSAGDYGNRIIIDHGDGISTLYAHASKLLVSVGDTVEQGDAIALVGETGSATGPHLHIEVRVNNVPHDVTAFLELPE